MTFLDTNVFLYAIGREHPDKEPCREILRRVTMGKLPAVTSAEVIQELLHVLTRRQRRSEAATAAREAMAIVMRVLPVGKNDLQLACTLIEALPSLGARDALHAATMRNAGIRDIVSADADFDMVPDLHRTTPAGMFR